MYFRCTTTKYPVVSINVNSFNIEKLKRKMKIPFNIKIIMSKIDIWPNKIPDSVQIDLMVSFAHMFDSGHF